MTGLGTYWHTLRHLRPVQVYGRLRGHLRRVRPDLRPAPPRRPRAAATWVPPAPRPRSFAPPGRFTFLGQTHDLGEHGWDDATLDMLWRYNLHYFDDLAGPAAAEHDAAQKSLLARWVRENRPGTGTGWEPFPTSLRIVNWVKWAWAGNELPPECVHSLAVQLRWLARNLETHLLGNHLFANAKALVFGGLFFDGAEGARWLSRGLTILASQLPEQILPDGGQFERSPMYHALALEDMLDLHNALRADAAALPTAWRSCADDWPDRIEAMRQWLAAMCHPDGEIGLFNDAAFGIAPTRAELERYAVRLGFTHQSSASSGVTRLAPSGYIRVANGALVALLDVGPVGPDYLPGHAHADTLSFELSLFGRRVLVNSGTSCYGASAERLRQRGTAAHNTVTIDDADSSEVWSGFRVARRARPHGLEVLQGDALVISCAHDGFRWLPGRPQHRRRWTFNPQSLEIEDRVTGPHRRAVARYHLHPDVRVADVARDHAGAKIVTLLLPAGERVRLTVQHGTASVTDSTWHPEFGCAIPSQCLAIVLEGGHARLRIEWDTAA